MEKSTLESPPTMEKSALQRAVRNTTRTHFMSERSQKKYSKRFSWLTRAIATVAPVADLAHVQRLHWGINRWTREGALQWKQAKMATFSATAVAGAIFAGTGVTALQLNDSANSNWIARAFFLYSTMTGVGCVMMSTYMHNRLSDLDTDEQIRFYLSRGLAEVGEDDSAILQTLPLESSLAASMLLEGPTNLLTEAAGFFLMGLVLLYLLEWIGRGPTPDDYRNIFIVGICVFVYYGSWLIFTAQYILIDHVRWKAQFVGDDDEADPESVPSRRLASLRRFWAAMEQFAADPHCDPDIDSALQLVREDDHVQRDVEREVERDVEHN